MYSQQVISPFNSRLCERFLGLSLGHDIIHFQEDLPFFGLTSLPSSNKNVNGRKTVRTNITCWVRHSNSRSHLFLI